MSNIIPPLLSNSPPPPPSPEEDEDDEFGDFTIANDLSYDNDSFSPLPSPEHVPIAKLPDVNDNLENNKDEKIPNSDFSTEGDITRDIKIKSEISSDKNNSANVQNDTSLLNIRISNLQNTISNSDSETFQKNILEKVSIVEAESLDTNKNDCESEDHSEIKLPVENLGTGVKLEANDVSSASDTDLFRHNIENVSENCDILENSSIKVDISDCEQSLKENSVDSTRKNSDSSKQKQSIVDVTEDLGDFSEFYSGVVEEKSRKNSCDYAGSEEFEEKAAEVAKNDASAYLDDVIQAKTHPDSDRDEEFAQFASHQAISNPSHAISTTTNDDFDDFRDFSEFSRVVVDESEEDRSKSKDSVNSSGKLEEKASEVAKNDASAELDDLIQAKTYPDSDRDEEFAHFASHQAISNPSHPLSTITNEDFDDFRDFSAFSRSVVDEKSKKNSCDHIGSEGDRSKSKHLVNSSGKLEENASDVAKNDASADLDDLSQAKIHPDSDTDEEFAHFASHQAISHPHSTTTNEDFDDFGDFTSTTCDQQPPVAFPAEEEEDFQSFADFSNTTAIEDDVCLLPDEKDAFRKAQQILKEMFPALGKVEGVEDFDECFKVEENDRIFKQLQDVTDTPALAYQWSKSACQQALLKALNIDVRNILYGPSWNASMPRFAANLGLQPLEPIKTTDQPSVKASQPVVQAQTVDIPSAKFDWTGSGLVNPLDSLPKETISTQQTEPLSSTVNKLPDTLFEPTFDTTPRNDEFKDFTSYQPPTTVPQTSDWHHSTLPLRETYISNQTPEGPTPSIAAWLQPTILTPELPRKPLNDDQEENAMVKKIVVDEDEFDEFQSSSPLPESASDQKLPLDFLSGLGPPTRTEAVPREELGVTEIEDKSSSVGAEASIAPPQEEEEFTDFQFSAPAAIQPSHSAVLTPTLAPLKPLPVLQATPTTTPINWPDPGITDDDIRKLEEVFSSKQDQPTSKSLDDDVEEWSEFVSVPKPSPVHKVKKSADRERTASPDLPLSVLNLGSVQPARQPIPVITHHGIVQTKLATMARPSSHTEYKPAPPSHQPSTISEQYSSQAYGFGDALASNRTWGLAGQKTCNDDDEWGEFVSSPLPPKGGVMQNGHVVNGRGANLVVVTPNRGRGMSRFGGGGGVSHMGGGVSNLVLPDLDFVAPKGWRKK